MMRGVNDKGVLRQRGRLKRGETYLEKFHVGTAP